MTFALAQSYRYALLDPRRSAATEAGNAALLGLLSLGIEVSEPDLAARCGLGNIDPQHQPDGGTQAAIESAVTWPLPPPGATLATIRPDADAFGAMAVLTLRASGTGPDASTLRRVAMIGRADSFDFGAWPGPRPMPTSPAEIDEVGPGVENLGALALGLLKLRSAPAGVQVALTWLRSGGVESWMRSEAEAAAEKLFTALCAGDVLVTDAVPGRAALVQGAVPGALRLGYRRAPVVLAVGDSGARVAGLHYAIAQWTRGHVDLVKVAALLRREEPGWGGSPTIIGSPQHGPSRLPLDRVVAILGACLA